MNIDVNPEYAIRIIISFIIGALIGFEREYRTKAAGLRTMILICLGSTVFTMVSLDLDGTTKDRIASTIVTGVGFLGAGVIFKDGISVTGLTTATAIWISAALGMAIGYGEYFIAFVSSGIVLIVLSLLENVQQLIEHLHQVRSYKISVRSETIIIPVLEFELKKRKLKFRKKRDLKEPESFLVFYDIAGNEKTLDEFNEFLKHHKQVQWFQY